jgi:pyruvate formate lyase activating enzyme
MLIKFLEKNKQLFWIRQVLVPGYTDDPKDLRKVGKFIKQLKYLDKFEILPYHRLALSKYRQLNIVYHLLQIKEPTKQMIDKVKKLINSQ